MGAALALLTAWPTGGAGQLRAERGLGLTLGFEQLGLSDPVASALHYGGNTTGLAVEHWWRGPASRSSIELSYRGGSLHADLARPSSGVGHEAAHGGALAYERLWASRRSESLDVLVGARLDVRALARTHDYAPFGDELYIDLVAPLEAAAGWSRRLGSGGELWHRVAVPLASLVLRDPWTGAKYPPSPGFAAPWGLWGFDHRLTYRSRPSRRLRLEIGHRLTYLRRTGDPALTLVVHGVVAGVAWAW